MGISPDDWQEIAEEPAFHLPVTDAREEAINNYLADAEKKDDREHGIK